MKYVVIVVFVIILVRIDVILRLFDKTALKIENRPTEITARDVDAPTQIIPIGKDLSLQISSKSSFLSMLNDFRASQDESVKEAAIEILRGSPQIFSEAVDSDLEASVYRFRDLLIQKNKATHELLLEMMKSLKGDNLAMVRRFYSLSIDIDLEEFLKEYSTSSDSNCIIMGHLADNLPFEERFNELSERLRELDAFLLTEGAEAVKAYGRRCQIVLGLQVDKMKMNVIPVETPAIEAPVETSTPALETNP
jgi:hypothetical protein